MKKHSNKINLEVRIDPNEVLRRIAETSDLQKFTLFESGSKPFTYSVSGNVINIQKQETYRNNFRSSLSLKVEATNYGSKLSGRFSMGILPIIFIIGWLTVTGSLSLLLIAGALGIFGPTKSEDALIPIFLFFCGLVMVVFARFLAKGEEQEISEWLNNLFADSIV